MGQLNDLLIMAVQPRDKEYLLTVDSNLTPGV
jgi:hypothetical protein